ncbi:MAG: hypothetical protein NC320_13330 [Clostridium sp.]|nr:hypothetical protein [Clostridium sp.]
MKKEESNAQSAMDILNLPVGEAIGELLKMGAKAIRGVAQTTKDVFQSWADEEYMKMCRPVVTMTDCVSWLKLQRSYYPAAGYFFIYVEKNPAPRNANDQYSVTLALLDKSKKPLFLHNSVQNESYGTMVNSQDDIVCIVIPTKTIDEKLINALNGTKSVLIKL